MKKDYTKEELATYAGKVIRQLRLDNGYTQAELGRLVGVGDTAIGNYERGFRAPLQDTLFKLADVFGVSIDSFFPRKEGITRNINTIYNKLEQPRQEKVYEFAEYQLEEQNNTVQEEQEVYLVGQTAAGQGVAYGDEQYDKIKAQVPDGADYALTVQGDSMEPDIKDGSIIFYKDQPTLENGQIGIVEINREEVTCKKFYKEGDKVILRSINPKYDDMVFDEGIRILGKVIL